MSTKPKKKNKPSKNSQKKTKKDHSFKDEIILLIVIAVSLLLFVSIYSDKAGVIGLSINKFIFGIVGFIAYIIPFYMILITIFKLANKTSPLAKRKILFSGILLMVLTICMHVFKGGEVEAFSFVGHYNFSSTYGIGGGVIGGILGDAFLLLFGVWGTYIILLLGMIVLTILLTEKSFIKLVKKLSNTLYQKLQGSIQEKKQKKLINQKENVKPNKKETKEEFTIEHYKQQKEAEENHKKELKYASKDPSNMLEKSTIPEDNKKETIVHTKDEISNDEGVKNANKKTVEDHSSEVIDINEDIVATKEEDTYEFPPIELLQKGEELSNVNSEATIRTNATKLVDTLENFGVKAKILNVSCGPTVTRYELQPEQGVKVSKIVNLSDDIKLNMAVSDLRIEAPIPGKAAVGIEVPNEENQAVLLREIIESEEFKKYPSHLAFSIGKDIAGKIIVADMAKMPHLLVAGATGSGKSVCINTLITSIIYKAKPSEVKLIMIDPKMVELSVYNGIPHLLIPVVTDPKKASSALNWAVAEMTDRYKKFAEHNVRDLKGYNNKVQDLEGVEQLPQMVIIVDELADLMMVAPNEVEDAICRLAQMARAAGIHLVIATQRPSVNVITGVIKANIPSRIAFSVSSGTDSRTIIDMNGAEKLLGKGDMLFAPVGYNKPLRVQGAFISDKEVSNIVEFVKNNQEDTHYNKEVIEEITTSTKNETEVKDRDEFFEEAAQLVIDKDKASISMFQRVFRIGFNRASRLMEQLYEAGIVGPEEGSKPRKVLKTMEEIQPQGETDENEQ
ncbi:S-DNA-T family DNA segregation ATPase FtsK/SpoIIIE [Natranaerovirga hydrolytica]|uniref:S-DNA-T family DNA segregation ATPase FtsK/SpoIIIE n=1 Tax=Natranaerovirga hydrolytica TaxID=680378 RepID=A0A4R1N5Q9_9FIRM|nr:DNA translocase FtsK [Natranaerovirga hydrolytica]TCK97953.1 S-DNA-T family DNA segregation ATPase FtsK/SpoIIIE [Natranaerovirga hydrolytica]